ncbi:hypothetical protein J3R83DRAFT_10364 [Lanmaoa asiatica]|nr:hypothetical protein J3R83DRAFT_10364 [Lanmaoa asiatica]
MPQSPRKYPSWTTSSLSQSSSAKLVCSTSESEELFHQAPTLYAPPTQRLLLTPSFPQPPRMPESRSKGTRQDQKVNPINDMPISGGASVMSSTGPAQHAKLPTIWTTGDSYLPRAKPPSPLKYINDKQNSSENITLPPIPTISSQPSTLHHRPSRQPSELHSTASRLLQPSLDTRTSDRSNVHRDRPVVQHPLARSTTRITTASDVSDTDTSFVPSSGSWRPPTSWAGLSRVASTGEDGGSKPVARCPFTGKRKKSGKSSTQDGSAQVPTHVNRARLQKKMWPAHLANVGEPEEEASDIWGVPLPSSMIKVQCYVEGNGWEERPIADVIPKLRELKVG